MNHADVSPLDILVKAREILSKRGAWTRLAAARNSDNSPVSADDPDAVSFCMVGGLRHAVNTLYPGMTCDDVLETVTPARLLLSCYARTIVSRERYDNIETWNDRSRRTKKQVLQVFDAVIAEQNIETPAVES